LFPTNLVNSNRKVTKLILPGAKLNSCFLDGLKGKTQDVFCNMPPTSLALDNCSCIVLILSIHGHIRVPEFSAIAYEPALMRRPGAQG
jgi:hypothetical protein